MLKYSLVISKDLNNCLGFFKSETCACWEFSTRSSCCAMVWRNWSVSVCVYINIYIYKYFLFKNILK